MPPMVEIDAGATAAYIRLRAGPVARTQPFGGEQSLVTVDFDAADQVIGIETIGQQEFSISELLKLVPTVQASETVLARTRHVAADLQTA